MPADPLALAGLAVLMLLGALLYSSVGHAGASAYLAILSLYGVAPAETKPIALVLNILVAVVGTARFASAGLVPWRLLLPFCAGSVPAAFVGGAVSLPTHVHRLLLGIVLLFAAGRLWWRSRETPELRAAPSALVLVALGAALGLLAGLTGVGGGIFLSPLLILMRWQDVRKTAGASVAFILVNSIAGIAGHFVAGRVVPSGTWLLAPAVIAGGVLGSWLGAKRLGLTTLRRTLGAVLAVASIKLLAD
jgi:uncharacterized membrane protein YfcA